MPSTRLYWNSEFYFEKVAQIMTINRFEFIKSNLHCNDNLKCPPNCEDKLYNFLKSYHQKNYVLMNKWFYLKGYLILSNTILKNPRNGTTKYVFFQELMELSLILKSVQIQSCMPWSA